MRRKFDNLKELYDELVANRSRYESVWQDIADYVGIQVDPTYQNSRDQYGETKDQYVDDPTAALSVNQAGDYLQGILWGTGDEVVTLEPSEWITQRVPEKTVNKYFQFRTSQLLKNMNHSRSGLNAAMKSYFYDQVAFGTSGIGCFKNPDFFDNQTEECPYTFRPFGVDNIAIDEGKSGLVDILFVTYQWRVNRIVSEFEETYDALPKRIKEAYEKKNYNQEFTIVQGIYPRDNFDPKLKGKRGTKYRASWFMEEDSRKVFFEEDFRTFPAPICRAIKLRGEVYGRSSGSLLLSSIKSVNYMFGKSVEILEKMASPALGTWNNALFGDSVLDTSAEGLVVFNQAMQGNAQVPIFPLQEIGDPTGIIKFLIPYLNEKITTGFKVDVLLDFSSDKDMTARESMLRYSIRGKSLAGILQQQKVEEFEPLIHRAIQVEDDNNLAGINPYKNKELAVLAEQAQNAQVIIPDVILEAMKQKKQWYKIKFNNELDRLTKTQAMERVMQAVNAIMMIGSAFPMIVEGVEWYAIWQDVNKYLGTDYAKSEKEFKEIILKEMKMRQEQAQLAAMKEGSEVGKNVSSGRKNAAEAEQINSGASTGASGQA